MPQSAPSRVGCARTAGHWAAHCPAHHDSSPSLSISLGRDGRILLHCFTGCSINDIVAAMRLEVRQLFPPAGAVRSECQAVAQAAPPEVTTRVPKPVSVNPPNPSRGRSEQQQTPAPVSRPSYYWTWRLLSEGFVAEEWPLEQAFRLESTCCRECWRRSGRSIRILRQQWKYH